MRSSAPASASLTVAPRRGTHGARRRVTLRIIGLEAITPAALRQVGRETATPDRTLHQVTPLAKPAHLHRPKSCCEGPRPKPRVLQNSVDCNPAATQRSWTPAFAGVTMERTPLDPCLRRGDVGTHSSWTPAFAGATLERTPPEPLHSQGQRWNAPPWTPAFAGVTMERTPPEPLHSQGRRWNVLRLDPCLRWGDVGTHSAWTPAFAGVTLERTPLDPCLRRGNVGTHSPWTPAFAGVTLERTPLDPCLRRGDVGEMANGTSSATG